MKTYRNTAFLVELLINVLVFSISCAILVGVFGKASTLARDTREESYASTEILSLFETAKARGAGAITAEGIEAEHELYYYYDRSWTQAEQESAQYRVVLHVTHEDTPAGGLYHLTATAEHYSGREICTLETTLYAPA